MQTAFTTTAMAAALADTTVSYEDLAAIERSFDDIETEIIRKQAEMSAEIYTKRQELVSKIPSFWPLVLEQAPPDIDQYIQPSDSALLLSHLSSFSCSRFELSTEPRSILLSFTFEPNDVFKETVLEKRFWYRRAKDGFVGLVSEPVRISWKEGKDLTSGLLDLVCDAYSNPSPKTKEGLEKAIEGTGMGGLSFFAWFGYIGHRVSAAENAEVLALEKEGKGLEEKDDDDEDDDEDMELEIFPDGDDLALAFADDLWPGALRYFTQAQETDALSDGDFESDAEIEDLIPGLVELDEDSKEEPAAKRVKKA